MLYRRCVNKDIFNNNFQRLRIRYKKIITTTDNNIIVSYYSLYLL